jgi:hypothetical protein
MYIEQLREMITPPSQNTVAVCNQTALLILYYISSSLVTLLKVTDAPIEVSDILDLTASFKFNYFISNVVIPLCLLIIKVYNYQSTQPFIASYAYYSDMFRLNRVIIRPS